MASNEYLEGHHAGDNYEYDGRRLSHLAIKNIAADYADSDVLDNTRQPRHVFSHPGTPDRRQIWDKDYDSDSDAPWRRRRPQGRERRLEQSWEMRRSREASHAECQVLVRPQGRDSQMRMDMEEVKACRDLGIELPCDWTVEIPYTDTSSGGNSPVNSWPISSPGDDPKDVKARLKSWAQAVAFASTSAPNA